MTAPSPGDTRSLITALEKQGWKVTKTANGHYRAVPPDPSKQIVVFSSGRSDTRGWRNALEDLRRNGFDPNSNGSIAIRRVPEWEKCPNCNQRTWSVHDGKCFSAKCAERPAHHVAEHKLPQVTKDIGSESAHLEDLFQALRDAKELHALAVAESDRAKADLLKAKERVDGCLRAEGDTAKDLLEAKRAFDAAFGIRPPE